MESQESHWLRKNANLLEPRRLGSIRDELKLRDYFAKLSRSGSRSDNVVTDFSGCFREAKAVRTEIEAKRAQTMCHVRRMMAAPR